MAWTPPERLPSIAEMVVAVRSDVVGLDDQVGRLCTAVHRHAVAGLEDHAFQRSNVLVIGPTGGGKTYLAQRALEASGLPFIEVNATQFSEVGYKGRDLAWMFDDFVIKYSDREQRPKEVLRLVERFGVVILDEFDKWRQEGTAAEKKRHNPGASKERQPGWKLQAELLKMTETDWIVTKRHEEAPGMPFQTGRVLFIGLGAFEGLDTQMEGHFERPFPNIYMKAEPSDIMEYGFMQELVGRFPVIVPFPPLQASHLVTILQNAVWPRYQREALDVGVELVADESALLQVAQLAITKGIGARAFANLLDAMLWRAWAQAKRGDRIELGGMDVRLHTPEGGGARLIRGGARQAVA